MKQWSVTLKIENVSCTADMLVEAEDEDSAREQAIAEVSDLDWSVTDFDDEDIEVSGVEEVGA